MISAESLRFNCHMVAKWARILKTIPVVKQDVPNSKISLGCQDGA